MVISSYKYHTTKYPHLAAMSLDEYATTCFTDRPFELVRQAVAMRHKPNCCLVVFEDIAERQEYVVRRVADLMDIKLSPELLETVMHLSSKAVMLKHVHKFDNTWVSQKVAAKSNFEGDLKFNTTPKVTEKGVGKEEQKLLDPATIDYIQSRWRAIVGDAFGCASHTELRAMLRREEEEGLGEPPIAETPSSPTSNILFRRPDGSMVAEDQEVMAMAMRDRDAAASQKGPLDKWGYPFSS